MIRFKFFKNLIFIFFFTFSLTVSGQNLKTKNEIDSLYIGFLNNKTNYKVLQIIERYGDGNIDSISYFFNDKKLVLINVHSATIGISSTDYHVFTDILIYNNKMIFLKQLARTDEFDKGFTNESRSKIEEQISYLNLNSKCIFFSKPRNAEGNRVTVYTNLSNQPFVSYDCMYCPFSGNEGNEYVLKLIEKYPEYQYLLQD